MRTRSTIQVLAGMIGFGLLLSAVPLFTQQKFNPKEYQPQNCMDGSMKCGLVPASKDQMDSVPQADSNFVRHRGLPSSVDLSPNMPPIGNQATQGSCVGWSTAYAIKSYHEQVERKWGYDSPFNGGAGSKIFSPAFVYNQINGGRDGGSNPVDALNLMVRTGVATWKTMPYDVKDFRRAPSQQAKNEAAQYREESFRQVDHFNPAAIKAELAKGNPVLIGIQVYDSFYNLGAGVYDHYEGQFYGGHAIAVVGYDDSKVSPTGHKGAFKLFNSWSTQWGDKGYGWISYDFMPTACLGAFVTYDLKAKQPEPGKTDVTPEKPQIQDEEVKTVGSTTEVVATRGTFTDRVEVRWKPVANAVSYEVQRAEPGSDSFGKLALASATGHADRAINADVAYRYRVVSIGDGSRSDAEESPIAEGFAKAKAETPVPAKVVGLEGRMVATAGGGVNLSWRAVGGAQAYIVSRYDDSIKRWRQLGTPADASFADRSAKPGMNSYRVRAQNAKGAGEWSDTAKVQVGGSAQEPPSRVEGVTASEGTHKDKIAITWGPAAGAQKYFVFRYNPETEQVAGPFETTTTNYDDISPDAKSGKLMAYVVVAGNPAGYSEYSEPAAGASSPNMKRAGEMLSPPLNVTATIDETKGTITLKWEAVKGIKPDDSYYVLRKREKDKEFKDMAGTVTGTVTTFSEKIPGKPGELYLYTVRSKPMLGTESKNSNIVGGFINETKTAAKHRFMADEGLDRFLGKWGSRYWDGETAPKDVVIELKGDGKKFTGTVQFGKNPPSTFTGNYVAKSDVIEVPGLKIQLRDPTGKQAVVELRDGAYAPVELKAAFTRVK